MEIEELAISLVVTIVFVLIVLSIRAVMLRLVVPTMPSMFRREVSPGEKRALRWTTWITIIGIAVEIVRYGLKRLS